MTTLIDARPPGLDVKFRPGDPFTFELTWQDDAGTPVDLTGRTFTATLDAASLDVATLVDVMTVTATAAQTTAAAPTGTFTLTETTGATTDVLIVGTWAGSRSAAATTSQAATVVVGTTTVAVTVTSNGTVAELTSTGDATIGGQILTGTFGTPATFGGIEREARCFPAGELLSPTAQVNFGDGVPRINMPADLQTDVYAVIEVEEWWLDSTIGVYFEWVNDHTAGGDVRWECEFREYSIGQSTMAAGGSLRSSRTFTQTAPGADLATTGVAASIAQGNEITFDPGPLAAFYVLRISRLGADVLDTLDGPVGFVAANMTRGQ